MNRFFFKFPEGPGVQFERNDCLGEMNSLHSRTDDMNDERPILYELP